MENVIVFDNEGKTTDRYSIVNVKTGDVWGASEDPFHPQGVGQFNHNIPEYYWYNLKGAGWWYEVNQEKGIKIAVSAWLHDTERLGKKINIVNLPEAVKRYIALVVN